MDLYLIRHGRTVFNQEDRHQYSTTPLAKEGFAAAEKLAARLKDIHFDALYTSPMLRAVQTASVLENTLGLKSIELEDLREQKHPTVVEGQSKKDPLVKKIHDEISLHSGDPNWHHSDEDNYWDVRDRVLRLQKYFVGNHAEDATILAVSHGICIKMLVATIIFGKEVTPEQFMRIYHYTITSNTGITHCRYTEKIGWQLYTLNDDAHL